MTCYFVLAITSTTKDWMDDYIPVATGTVAKHGGSYLGLAASDTQVEGTDQAARTRVIIEWPSRDATLNFMSNPAYEPHLAARTAGSESTHLQVEGIDDLARANGHNERTNTCDAKAM